MEREITCSVPASRQHDRRRISGRRSPSRLLKKRALLCLALVAGGTVGRAQTTGTATTSDLAARLAAVGGLCAVFLAVPAHRAYTMAAASCESLASLTLPHVEITRAQLVPAGKFAGTPAGILAPGDRSLAPYNALPEFCRVAATLTPSSDSDIRIEVWLPASTWNGKLQSAGNGGWGGQLSVQTLAGGIARGYAIATTDTGHAGPDGSFALNHPEKLIDFAYRAVHEMTVQAKTIHPRVLRQRSRTNRYWNGCSTGGRQGLKEAQRYPADYDGIIAGTPTNYMTHQLTQILWVAHATLKDPAGYIPKEKYAAIHQAALTACDALDGVTDGVIDDPTRCHFDPKAIQCTGDDAPTCLTTPQVEAARRIYAPVKNPRTGAVIFPGLEPGSELGWARRRGRTGPDEHRDRLLQVHRVQES